MNIRSARRMASLMSVSRNAIDLARFGRFHLAGASSLAFQRFERRSAGGHDRHNCLLGAARQHNGMDDDFANSRSGLGRDSCFANRHPSQQTQTIVARGPRSRPK
jgi:hypothetical protein